MKTRMTMIVAAAALLSGWASSASAVDKVDINHKSCKEIGKCTTGTFQGVKNFTLVGKCSKNSTNVLKSSGILTLISNSKETPYLIPNNSGVGITVKDSYITPSATTTTKVRVTCGASDAIAFGSITHY